MCRHPNLYLFFLLCSPLWFTTSPSTLPPRVASSSHLQTPSSRPYATGLQHPANTSISDTALDLSPPLHPHCQSSTQALTASPLDPNGGSQHLSSHHSHSPQYNVNTDAGCRQLPCWQQRNPPDGVSLKEVKSLP